jgi:8-oxo-dGTP diphosphatase
MYHSGISQLPSELLLTWPANLLAESFYFVHLISRCMCAKQYKNPVPTVDVIIQRDFQILFVKRKKNPFKQYLALPGGFVDEGETVEVAATREVRAETSLDVELTDILGVYSDPKRDPRGHIMSTVFIGKILDNSNDKAIAGDDALELEWIMLEDTDNRSFAFDHKKILSDYRKWKKTGGTFWSTKGKDTNSTRKPIMSNA